MRPHTLFFRRWTIDYTSTLDPEQFRLSIDALPRRASGRQVQLIAKRERRVLWVTLTDSRGYTDVAPVYAKVSLAPSEIDHSLAITYQRRIQHELFYFLAAIAWALVCGAGLLVALAHIAKSGFGDWGSEALFVLFALIVGPLVLGAILTDAGNTRFPSELEHVLSERLHLSRVNDATE
jgi:hypothetical protein